MKTIVKIKHGSHLYGTNTETSDLDFKGVHIPDAERILLQTANKTVDTGTNKTNEKNTKDDIDDQSYPLQKFFEMLVAGDTVATEILFAPEEAIVEQSDEWPIIQRVGKSLLNRQCKGFVGYCQRQAAKYGIKGSRMATCENAMTMFHDALDRFGPTALVGCMKTELEGFVSTHEHSSLVELAGGNGVMMHFECCDRKVPYNASLRTAYELYEKIYNNYGARAKAAKDNEGIDWKAVSHAVRVAEQAIELLKTGHITFPRPDAEYLLLKIKRGELDYKWVSRYLEGLVDEVEEVSLTSTLPEESSKDALNGCVMFYYSKQIIETFSKAGE